MKIADDKLHTDFLITLYYHNCFLYKKSAYIVHSTILVNYSGLFKAKLHVIHSRHAVSNMFYYFVFFNNNNIWSMQYTIVYGSFIASKNIPGYRRAYTRIINLEKHCRIGFI